MLIYSIIALIMSNAINNRRDSSIIYSRISILILISSLLISYNAFYNNYIIKGIVLYNGLICIENYTFIFTLFIYILSIIIISINSFFPIKNNNVKYYFYNYAYYIFMNFILIKNIIYNKFIYNIFIKNKIMKFLFKINLDSKLAKENFKSFLANLEASKYINDWYKLHLVNIKDKIIYKNYMKEQYRILEYPLIILFCIIGAIFLMSSFDIISIFLSIELQSYALYLICSIYRNSESSVSAGLTYFLLGGLSSCIILMGIGLLYINSGTTSLENLYIINSISNIFIYYIQLYYIYDYNINIDFFIYLASHDIFINNLCSYISTQYLYIQISLIIMSVGFLFKISSAPFHFWSPDVYDAIPTIVTTFVAIIPKISIIIFLYKLIYYTSSDIISLPWINNIIISSILSLIIGSVLGLTQYRIKRLYAYSTISHLGFILLGLSINNLESSKAMFFYIFQYSVSNLNAFIILIAIGYSLRNYILNNNSKISIKDINYSPIQLISQLKGYYNINPLIAISLSITLFSFAGIPPLVGFFAKQMILTAAIDNGFIFITFICIITSVISATYYLIIIKMIFFEKSDYILNNNLLINKENNYIIASHFSFIISIFSLFIILFMFFDQEIYRLIYII